MSIFKRVNERKILHTPIEPSSTAWLWLKTENGVSTLYDFVNGKWTPVGGYTEDYEHNNHDSEWGGDQQQNTSYVTWDSLNGKVGEIYSTVETWLSGYLKEADFSNYITNDELSTAVSESMSGVLKDYQPLLRAGQSITITAVATRDLDRETDERVMSSLISVKMGAIGPSKKDPISGATAYAEFQSVYSALNNKQTTLVSGTNIKTINNNSLLGSGNLAVQAPINDLAAIRSGAAAGATSVQTNQLTNLLRSNLKTINGNSIVGSGNIIIQGGSSTSGTPVAVIDHGDPVPAEQGVYFFAYSPLQVEGDYNNLLQNGTENGYTFSPGTLYSLGYSKRTVNGVEEGFLGFNVDDTPLDVRDNVVYVNDQITTMKYYGDVVVSDKTKMADTSDMAIVSFMVACPFAADSTRVTVGYNSNDVSVKWLSREGTSNSSPVWSDILSGGFTFRNTGGGSKITLKIIRKDKNYQTKKQCSVTLNNGYEDTVVDVVYNPTLVYFKGDDVGNEKQNGYNTSEVNAYIQQCIDGTGDNMHCDDPTKGAFAKINTSNTDRSQIIYQHIDRDVCLLNKDVPIDLSKYNVLYIVTDTVSAWSWMDLGAYLDGWLGATRQGVLEDRDKLYAKTYFGGSAYEFFSHIEKPTIQKYGYTVLRCPITKMRLLPTYAGKDILVNLYSICFGISLHIKEFGVITYDY